jgi:hypothetical protein
MKTTERDGFTRHTLLAILTANADRAELDATITALTRSLANAHDIPATYPPVVS